MSSEVSHRQSLSDRRLEKLGLCFYVEKMGRQKLLLITFLVIASGFGGQCQTQSNMKNGFIDYGRGIGQDITDWEKGILNGINQFKDNALSKYLKGLPVAVKQWIDSGNYSSANVSLLLETLPRNAWNALRLEHFFTMTSENFTKLLTDGTDIVPNRILDEFTRLQANNKTKDEVLSALNTKACRMGEMGSVCGIYKSTLLTYLGVLGNPRNLTSENLTELRDAIYNFPPRYLAVINDEKVIQNALNIFAKCWGSSAYYCPSSELLAVVYKLLIQNLVGKSNTWTTDTVTKLGGASVLASEDIAQLPKETLLDIKPQLIQIQFLAVDGRQVIEALLHAENVASFEQASLTVNTWLNGLGSLKTYVLPWDVPADALNNAAVNTTLYNNANKMLTMGILPLKYCRLMLKNFLNGKSAVTMTESDVNAAGMLLAHVPPFFLKQLVQKKLIKGILLTNLSTRFEDSGPGSRAKGRILLDAYLNTTVDSSTNWTVPANLISFITQSKLKTMSATNINAYLKKAVGKHWNLDSAQKAALLSKLTQDDVGLLTPALKRSLSLSYLNNLTSSQLRDFVVGMPPNSRAAIKLISSSFGSSISYSNMYNNNPEIAAYMQEKEAVRLEVNDIPDVLKLLNAAEHQPSLDTCQVLKNKMVQYLQQELDPKNEVEVARMLTPVEVENTPPCVLAALGKDALMNLHPKVKTILMENMKKADNAMGIPRYLRQLIIQEGLKPLGKVDRIRGDLLFDLGFGVLNLPPELIRKIDPGSAMSYLQIMEITFESHMKPCLDGAQRREVAALLESMKGPTSTWTDVRDCCCLLEVLSPSQLAKMPPFVLSSCTCTPNTDGFEDYMDARDSLCKGDIGIDEFNRNTKSAAEVKTRQIEAALVLLSDFTPKRRKRATAYEVCETASIGGAAVLTDTDINSMDNESVLNCLPELTQEKMDKTRARTVFKRIVLAKNNRLSNLAIKELVHLKWAWAGILAAEVRNLTTLNYTVHDDVVVEMGKFWGMEQPVIAEMAMKVLTEWRSVENLTAYDLIIMGQLICGFHKTSIEAIPLNQFRIAITTINSLQNCPAPVTQALAQKAIASYGNVDSWDAITVNELGNLIGGLPPEKLMKIPSEAFNGLTVTGLKSIPPQTIKALQMAQLGHLPQAVAYSMSAQQRARLNPEMLSALQDRIPKNSGGAVISPVMAVCMIAVAVLLLKQW